MGLSAVARKEFRHASRAHSLRGLALAFVVFAAFLAGIQHVPSIYRASELPTTTLALLNSMRQPTIFFVPLLGLVLGLGSIAGERASGSIKLALSPPNTRADVVLGAFVGRSAVVAVAILVGYGTVALVAFLTYEQFAVRIFAVYTLFTVGYGVVFVAIGVGFSAFFTSRPLALGVALALFGVFMLGWDAVLLLVQLATVGSELPESGLPEWITFVGLCNPSTAFAYAARAAIPEYYELTSFSESNAFYTSDWMGYPVLLGWILVPLSVGYSRFRRADL